jgi:hypothetical protein
MAGEVVLPPLVPIARGGTGIVSTPFQFVLTGAENLMIRSANSLVGSVVAVQGRLLQTDGTILPFSFSHTPNSDRTIAAQNFALGPGTLLTVTAFASSGAPTRGQTFIQLSVIQGFSGATILLGTLLQGYVTSFQQLSWPGSPLASSLDGRGNLYLRTAPNPPPGTGANVVVPVGVRWRLQQLTVTLTTDAVVVNRYPLLEFVVGGYSTMYMPTGGSVPASCTAYFTWFSGGQLGSARNTGPTIVFQSCALGPGIELRGNDQITVGGVGIDPGDQYSAVTYTVEEWLELN